jgi:hypothetical protein
LCGDQCTRVDTPGTREAGRVRTHPARLDRGGGSRARHSRRNEMSRPPPTMLPLLSSPSGQTWRVAGSLGQCPPSMTHSRGSARDDPDRRGRRRS